jgi:hypothetical protein
MKTLILAASAAAATLIGGAAMAQPYGYARTYERPYSYEANRYAPVYAYADRDRDGIPDRYDRYDNRRDRWAWRHHHREWRYDRYGHAYRW